MAAEDACRLIATIDGVRSTPHFKHMLRVRHHLLMPPSTVTARVTSPS
jgi:hypothetical protein